MKKLYPFLTLIFSLLILAQTSNAQFDKIIGYYPGYAAGYPTGINAIDLAKITHLNIAFANPDVNGNLIPDYGTTANITTVINACHARGVKVFISIAGGGAAGGNYQTLLSSAANINGFVTKLVAFTNTYNLDGIDVDIEGNILNGTILTAAQYENFVTALGAALHANNKKMSCAIGTWFGNYVTSAAANQFDWINMMSYDLCGPWTGACQHSPYTMAVNDFNYWNITKSVPASKLVVGVPFYGYGWGTYDNDGITYCDIVNTYPGSENNDQVGTGGNVIYYNGITTMKQKATYAKQNAAGIMIWELTQDCATTDSRSLLLAIHQAITLPVTWMNVHAEGEEQFIRIYWSTAEEKENDHFTVESSKDGINFKALDDVPAAGNSNSLNEYSYLDTEPLSGSLFYRIKQVDVDGKYSYSPNISITTDFSNTILFEVNPNPALQNEINVRFINSSEEQLLELTDVFGKVYYSETFMKDQLNDVVTLKLKRSISPGIYFLSASGKGKIYRLKIQLI